MPCRTVKIGDTAAIVCSRGRRPVIRCSHPDCDRPHTLLCDWPIGDGKTCDRPLCSKHARRGGPDTDYCLHH